MSTDSTDASLPAVLSPAQRLEASRARLRKAWIGEPRTDDDEASAAHEHDASMFHRLGELLAAGWARHPLKAQLDAAVSVMGPAARSTLGPLVQRHPLRLLAVAVGIGAVTIWLRPWRWLPRAALGSALVSALLPRSAIMGWISSGRWLDALRAENLEAWFGNRSSAAAPPGEPDVPQDAPTASASTQVPADDSASPQAAAPVVSAPVASSQEPTSYAGRAPAPIPAASMPS